MEVNKINQQTNFKGAYAYTKTNGIWRDLIAGGELSVDSIRQIFSKAKNYERRGLLIDNEPVILTHRDSVNFPWQTSGNQGQKVFLDSLGIELDKNSKIREMQDSEIMNYLA